MVQSINITEDNKLTKCQALFITQMLGVKAVENKNKEESFWKRRIDSNINACCKDVVIDVDVVIETWKAGMLKVVSAIFLLVCFVCLIESTCETRKKVFHFTSKALFVLEIIKF